MAAVVPNYPSKRRIFRRFPPVNIHFDIQIKSKKTASYFTLTLSLLSLSFFGIFAIKPTITTAVSLTKNIQDLKKLNLQYEDKIGSLIRAQTEYDRIRSDLPLIEAAIPANASFNKLVKAVERFADQQDVIINQLQIDTVPISTLSSSSKLYSFGFNISVLGKYPSLTSFIGRLTNWRRIVTINTLNFTKEVGSPGADLRLTLKGIAYYEP